MFCRSLFDLLYFLFLSLWCRYTASDYPYLRTFLTNDVENTRMAASFHCSLLLKVPVQSQASGLPRICMLRASILLPFFFFTSEVWNSPTVAFFVHFISFIYGVIIKVLASILVDCEFDPQSD